MKLNANNFYLPMFAMQNLIAGLSSYNTDFFIPYLIASTNFSQVELSRFAKDSPEELWNAYTKLLQFNMDLCGNYSSSSIKALGTFLNKELEYILPTFYKLLAQGDFEKLTHFITQRIEKISDVAKFFPEAIKNIEPEYGFHFEKNNQLFAETERFFVYKIQPTEKDVTVDEKAKPILIIPPFVLGCNILSFLPGEKKSYTHAFANQGIPTYIRVMKDISTTPAFQVMTMEDDARDTRFFCEKIVEKHGKKVTLNGYCQGGFSAVCNILSNELDDVVDALITCVAPMDGTRSKGLGSFLKKLPSRFNDLSYGTKTLPNGNKVADGLLMGWVYKLKSIEYEAPLVSFLRDISLFVDLENYKGSIVKTAAALNFWLRNERFDIPMAVTEMSFASYNIPVTPEGTLPVRIFDRELNFKGIKEKKIPWLLCYGEDDNLVEKETVLAPQDFVDVETAPFPKGHIAIAVSWSNPNSKYALHTRFGPNKKYRGPVRFQLDLNEALEAGTKSSKQRSQTTQKSSASKKTQKEATSQKTTKTAGKATTTKKKGNAKQKKSNK